MLFMEYYGYLLFFLLLFYEKYSLVTHLRWHGGIDLGTWKCAAPQIVFFTPVIYVIFGFHPCKKFDLICILVKKKITVFTPPPSNSPNQLMWRWHGFFFFLLVKNNREKIKKRDNKNTCEYERRIVQKVVKILFLNRITLLSFY